MDRKLMIKRLEIVIAVFLIVVVVLGIFFFAFRAIPVNDDNTTQSQDELLPGFPSDPDDLIKFLDFAGLKEFSASNKKVILPTDSEVNAAYNNTALTDFNCNGDNPNECTIYEISQAGRIFYITAPTIAKLKKPVAHMNIKKTLTVSGEEVEFTYTTRNFVNAIFNDAGEVTDTVEEPSLTTVEEVYACTSSKVCFTSGRLTPDKVANDIDVAAFEAFVQALVIQ